MVDFILYDKKDWDFPVVQSLRFQAPIAGDVGLIPGL